jgi:hypothetical protein
MTGTALTARETRALAVTRRHSLVASTVPTSSLDQRTISDAFALFERAYDGADRARFAVDLAEKQLVVLLRDRESGALKGFSTVLLQELTGKRPAIVVFSGDTVIDREYWGQKQLQIAFSMLLVRLKLQSPSRRVYWFLISKGYRTYLLLANAFARAVPRYDRVADDELLQRLHQLASTRFGTQYDPASGVIRYSSAHERVREGLAPITERHRRNPHVRFFVERNPGHANGDELACLAQVRFRDLARIGCRIAIAMARRALGVDSRARNDE